MFVLTFLQPVIEARAPKGAQMNINLQVLNSFLFNSCPPRDLQQKFAELALKIRTYTEAMSRSSEEIDSLLSDLVGEGLTGELTRTWRDLHRSDLDIAVQYRKRIPKKKGVKVGFKELAPEERPFIGQQDRPWLKDQMSELQFEVWWAVKRWKGTLIPSVHLDEFAQETSVEHLENAKERILRALNQLAGLGLIAKSPLPTMKAST